MKTIVQFIDRDHRPLSVGDRVDAVAVANGVPNSVHHGTVTHFGRTRVWVRWDDFAYKLTTFTVHAVVTKQYGLPRLTRICSAVRISTPV